LDFERKEILQKERAGKKGNLHEDKENKFL
jgi:hypothetical protein